MTQTDPSRADDRTPLDWIPETLPLDNPFQGHYWMNGGHMGLVQTLFQHLQTEPFQPYPSTTTFKAPPRASVVLLLQFRPPASVLSRNLKADHSWSLEEAWSQRWLSESQLDLLVLKRAYRHGDRWSGQLGFPGGRQKIGETDRATAERETFEEIGFDLKQDEATGRTFFLGRLNDRPIPRGFGSLETLLVVSSFVYLRLSPEPLQLTLDQREVAAAFFVPLSYFIAHLIEPQRLERDPVSIPLLVRTSLSDPFPFDVLNQWWQTLLGRVHFPAVNLALLEAHLTPRWMLQFPKAEMKVWGLSLSLVSDLLDLCFSPSQQWKRFRLTSLNGQQPRLDFADVNFLLNRIWSRPNTIGRRSDPHSSWEELVVPATLLACSWRSMVAYSACKRLLRSRL